MGGFLIDTEVSLSGERTLPESAGTFSHGGQGVSLFLQPGNIKTGSKSDKRVVPEKRVHEPGSLYDSNFVYISVDLVVRMFVPDEIDNPQRTELQQAR